MLALINCILPYEDCCTVFVPRHPIINPNLKHCEELESKFAYENLIEEILANLKVITINEEIENKYEDIL